MVALSTGGKHRRMDSEIFFKPRRRHIYSTCLALAGIAIVGFLASSLWTTRLAASSLEPLEEQMLPQQTPIPPRPEVHPWDSSNYLRGPPTDRFRDNLKPDTKYITSWISAGWTNDVMTYINLIYLGVLTNRVPIVAMFTPSHIGGHVPPVDFGEVFDVPRLQAALQKPVLEWHEVKSRSSRSVDELGCWNVWEAVQYREAFPRRSSVTSLLSLDLSYTKAPNWVKLVPRYEHDQHTSFSALATLGFPEMRADHLLEPTESPTLHLKLPPDEQVLCYDYLYYACAHQPYEFDFDHSPAWLFVGQYMHWTSRLENIAREYVRTAFGIEENGSIPPWISIHIRHGDFANWCGSVAIEDCFASISVIARRVEEVKQELLERKGLVVNHVIMTSDERNATWWEAVTAQGWYGIDHSQTVERYGGWYPVLVDAAIQSTGVGFVGTDRSTMSILARRRVQAWTDGAVRTLKWGLPGADDH